MNLIIRLPTKLRRDIVTLLSKLGTYLVFKRIWNPIDFQGQGHQVKFLPHNILVNTLEYHTIGTILKYHTVGTILKYHTVGTIPKSNRKIIETKAK